MPNQNADRSKEESNVSALDDKPVSQFEDVRRHDTQIERSSFGSGDSYYAWCTNLNCFWNSPRRLSEDEVRSFARKHEEKAEKRGSR